VFWCRATETDLLGEDCLSGTGHAREDRKRPNWQSAAQTVSSAVIPVFSLCMVET
jgi:hypothetical protein